LFVGEIEIHGGLLGLLEQCMLYRRPRERGDP
jgi:hypothetical protein